MILRLQAYIWEGGSWRRKIMMNIGKTNYARRRASQYRKDEGRSKDIGQNRNQIKGIKGDRYNGGRFGSYDMVSDIDNNISPIQDIFQIIV